MIIIIVISGGWCRERGEPVPADQSLDIARRIKERYCYIAADMAKVCLTVHVPGCACANLCMCLAVPVPICACA